MYIQTTNFILVDIICGCALEKDSLGESENMPRSYL